MKFGLDSTNAVPLANTIMTAERDGSHLMVYFTSLSSLKSGKVNRQARPKLSRRPTFLSFHADNGFAPLAHSIGIPALVEVTKEEA